MTQLTLTTLPQPVIYYSAKCVKIHDPGLDKDADAGILTNEKCPCAAPTARDVDTTSATGRAVKDPIRFHRSLIVISGEAHTHREVVS